MEEINNDYVSKAIDDLVDVVGAKDDISTWKLKSLFDEGK